MRGQRKQAVYYLGLGLSVEWWNADIIIEGCWVDPAVAICCLYSSTPFGKLISSQQSIVHLESIRFHAYISNTQSRDSTTQPLLIFQHENYGFLPLMVCLTPSLIQLGKCKSKLIQTLGPEEFLPLRKSLWSHPSPQFVFNPFKNLTHNSPLGFFFQEPHWKCWVLPHQFKVSSQLFSCWFPHVWPPVLSSVGVSFCVESVLLSLLMTQIFLKLFFLLYIVG